MKGRGQAEEFNDYRKAIIDSIDRWKIINELGCNDPGWPDGTNMNLVRNHIIYYKKKISEICIREGFEFPEEFYFPTPPEVDNNFMSNLKQKERVERLTRLGNILKTGKIIFDETQLSLF